MRTTTTSVVFAAGLCAVAAAQSPASPALPLSPATDALAGGGGALAQQQQADYSLRTLFQQEHGDFLLRRERYRPVVELRASSLTDASVQREPGRFDLMRLDGDFEIALPVATEGYITLGAFAEGRHYQTKNMPAFPDETLYSAGLTAGFGLFLGKDVLLEGYVHGGSWSDWDGTLNHRDYDFPAGMRATFRYSPELFWHVGARYNEVFEDANVLPEVGFAWATETVRVDVNLPESIEVSLWPRADLGILFGAQIQGAEYHVRTGRALGRQEANVRVQEVEIYTGVLWRLSDHMSFGLRAGASVAGDYKLDEGNSATAVVDGTLDPALFLQASIGFDF